MNPTTNVQAAATASADYDRLIRKSMAVACFLFPLLMLISVVFQLADDEVRRAGYRAWAWYAGVVVMLAVAYRLRTSRPRLAFAATVFCFVGGLTQMSLYKVEMEQLLLKDLGYDVAWDTTLDTMPPIGFLNIVVELWIIGMIMLGVAGMQTGVFSRLTGGLFITAAVAYFVYQSIADTITDAMPPVAFAVAAICFAIAVPPIGLQLWRGQVPEPAELVRTTAP